MRRRRSMDGTMRIAFLMVIIAGLFTGAAILQAFQAAPASPRVSLGADVWFVIAGGLVTVGINLEQLRRVRTDVKEMKDQRVDDIRAHKEAVELLAKQRDREHEQNREAIDKLDRRLDVLEPAIQRLDHRLEHIENIMEFHKIRRRVDRHELGSET